MKRTRLHEEGLINDKELAFRRQLVLSWLPKALLRNGGFLDEIELARVTAALRVV